MSRSLLALALGLTLAACDSSAPEAPANLFEVTVAPGTADARTVAGRATASGDLSGRFVQIVNPDELGDLTVTGIELRAATGPETFLLAGLTDGPLAAGTFALDALAFGGEPRDGEGAFFLLYLPGGEGSFDPTDPSTFEVGLGTGGSLTVTTASAETIAGSFAATVEILRGADDAEEIELEGTFSASASAE